MPLRPAGCRSIRRTGCFRSMGALTDRPPCRRHSCRLPPWHFRRHSPVWPCAPPPPPAPPPLGPELAALSQPAPAPRLPAAIRFHHHRRRPRRLCGPSGCPSSRPSRDRNLPRAGSSFRNLSALRAACRQAERESETPSSGIELEGAGFGSARWLPALLEGTPPVCPPVGLLSREIAGLESRSAASDPLRPVLRVNFSRSAVPGSLSEGHNRPIAPASGSIALPNRVPGMTRSSQRSTGAIGRSREPFRRCRPRGRRPNQWSRRSDFRMRRRRRGNLLRNQDRCGGQCPQPVQDEHVAPLLQLLDSERVATMRTGPTESPLKIGRDRNSSLRRRKALRAC